MNKRDSLIECMLKDSKKLFALVFVMSLFMTVPFLSFKSFADTDIVFHMYRIKEIAANLQDGIFMPAIQRNNMFGFGYLVEIFYPSLFMYVPALLYLITKHVQYSFVLFILLYNIFSFYIVYYSLRKTNNENALTYSLIFLALPFNTLKLLMWGMLGEFLATPFIFIAILGAKEVIENKDWKILFIGMTGLVYTHVISLLLVSVYFLIYVLINIKKLIETPQIVKNIFKAALSSIIAGMAFLFPLVQHLLSDTYKVKYNNSISSISVSLNFDLPLVLKILCQIMIILGLIVLYNKIKKKSEDEFLPLSICVIIYSLIMQTSLFPWELIEKIPLLNSIQFCYRVLTTIEPLLIYCLVYAAVRIKNLKEIVIYSSLSMVLMGSSVLMISSPEASPPDYSIYSQTYENYIEGTYINIVAGEYIPYDFKLDDKYFWEQTDVSSFFKNSEPVFLKETKYNFTRENKLRYTLEIETADTTDALLPLTYYINYSAKQDGQKITVNEKDGKIYLENLKSGKIEIKYNILNTEKISAVVSAAFILVLYAYCKKKKKHTN